MIPQTAAEADLIHVVWSGEIGGTERHVAAIARASGESQFRHHIVFLTRGGVIASRLVLEGLATSVGIRNGRDVSGFVRFGALVRQLRPRIVHFHTRNLAASTTVRLAAPSAHCVYTEHAPGALSGDRSFRLYYALFRRTTDRFIAIAPAMERCIREYGVPPEKITLVPHAVMIPLRDELRPIVPHTFCLGIVARLTRQKRVDLFLEIVAALRHRRLPVTALVVGDGPQRSALERRAANLRLVDTVVFAGEQEDVVPWLDEMDVFVMTSEIEPLGLTALEAMARGIPVVAMPCPGGLPGLVAAGGRLTADRKVESALGVIEEFLDNADARSDARQRGQDVVASRTIGALVRQLDRVYTSVEGTGRSEVLSLTNES